MAKKLKINNYYFVIFAAGVGKRIGKLGKLKPKSLLQINGKTILANNIEKLRKLGVKKISITVGYKKKKIIEHLKTYKKIRFNYINIKNFSYQGHGMTWYALNKYWQKEKKPMIILHGDIIYDIKYLKNIILSKKKDIIGTSSQKVILNKKKENWVAQINKKNQILKIDYIKNLKMKSGEIIGINKISTDTAKKIFKFMKILFNSGFKRKSWEFIINKFIEKNPGQLYTINNQNYNWVNINTVKDYYLAKKIFYEKKK